MLWQERFDSSPTWQYVDQARAHMDAAPMPGERSEQDALAYAGGVLELLEKRRSESDPRQITPTMLSVLGQATSNFAQYIQYVNSGTYTWATVTPQADAILDALAAWPPMKIARYLSGLRSATDSFQTKAAQAIEAVRERAQAVSDELEALASRQEGVRDLVETERQRISEAIAEFTADSSESIALVREEQEDRLNDLFERWNATGDEANMQADRTVARLAELEKEARNVVHATTSHIVATDYGRYARNKTVAAWACDVAAALVGAAGLSVLVYHLLSLEPQADANIGLSMTRLAVSLGTLGVAGLLGHRGQQHHLEATAAKRTDLALRQVLPFTANLEESEQRKIVREFTDRVFIRGELDVPKSPRPRLSLRRDPNDEAETITSSSE